MNRPRDRSSATGLLPRMEARPWKDSDKVTYRYHPVGGKPINLGTDREKALRAVLDMNGETAHHGSLLWCWEQYQTGRRFKRLAEGTRLDYGYAWKQIEKHMGSLPAASISPPMVARYVHITRADSPRRADLERSLLSMIFKHAIMLGVCERNPTVDVEPHGSTPSEVMPDELAMRRFLAWLDAASGHRKPRRAIGHMAEFASLVGARRVEFLDLTWAQVDLDAGVVRMPRAKQRRGIRLVGARRFDFNAGQSQPDNGFRRNRRVSGWRNFSGRNIVRQWCVGSVPVLWRQPDLHTDRAF